MFNILGEDKRVHMLNSQHGNELISMCGVYGIDRLDYRSQKNCVICSSKVLPVASPEVAEIFLEKLKNKIDSQFETYIKQHTFDYGRSEVETREDIGLSIKNLVVSYGFSRHTMEPLKAMDYDLSCHISVVTKEDRTVVFVDSITVPKEYRRRGIYTSWMREVKSFMEENGLGILVGCTDSSENEETSKTLDKVGLHWDPFLGTRLGWDE